MKPAGGKLWFTAAELAALALPGLPKSKRKINERYAEHWALATSGAGLPLARPRQARGGGMEYHVDVLPAAPRAELFARGVSAIVDVATQPETSAAAMWRWYEASSEKTKAEATRRAGIVALVDRLERAMLRSAAVPEAAARSKVGASTLWGWLAMLDGVAPSDRLPYLAPRRAGGGAEAEVDASIWQMLVSDYLRPEKPPFSACYRRASAKAAAEGLSLPCERTLWRKLEREVDGRLIVAKRVGAEAVKRMVPAQQRSISALHALETVNIDGHKWDVFCQWPDGRVGRPMMVAIQDVYSRKMLAWRIDESESALSTRLVFADLFATWGIPKTAILDNSRAFASKIITGGAKSRFRFKIKDEEPTGVLTALGIEIVFATPYHGQAKPIERAFRDLEGSVGKHPALAGANTGNSPMNKPENYGKRAIPIAEFEQIVSAGIEEHNRRVGRRTEAAQGRSFDIAFAESYAVAPIGKANAEQLRLALLTAEDRPCNQHDGTVTLDGNRYYAEALYAHRGKRLTLRFDPDDLHGEVHVYDRAGHYICAAQVIEADGFRDKEAAKRTARKRADMRRMVRDAEQLQDLISAERIAALMPDHAGEDAMPRPSVMRPVRHRGQTAAALKIAPGAEPYHASAIDRFADAAHRLHVVE